MTNASVFVKKNAQNVKKTDFLYRMGASGGIFMEIQKRDVVLMGVDEIIPYERNPRHHPESQIEELKNSIRQWGWTMPILIDEHRTVLAGHGRLFAAKELGISEVPCLQADGWSEEQKRAYVIADNQLANNSSWDTSMLVQELREVNSSGFDMSQFGFDPSWFEDYQPNLEPVSSGFGVDQSDLDKAGADMSGQISGISADKSASGTEVMCPYCAETFTFTGS